MKVAVTQQDIDRGLANIRELRAGLRFGGVSRCCPIALAMNRATGEEWTVGVTFCWSDGGERKELPTAASHFVLDCESRHVVPFEFDV